MGRRAAWGKSAEEELPQFYGSSEDFKRMLRSEHPDLVVPESEVVYLGENAAWGPGMESPHPPGQPCPDLATIGPGSRLCCPKCHHSGHERRLAEQRRLAGDPPPERPVVGAPPKAPARPRTKDKRSRWWRTVAWSKQEAPKPPKSTPSSGRRSA